MRTMPWTTLLVLAGSVVAQDQPARILPAPPTPRVFRPWRQAPGAPPAAGLPAGRTCAVPLLPMPKTSATTVPMKQARIPQHATDDPIAKAPPAPSCDLDAKQQWVAPAPPPPPPPPER